MSLAPELLLHERRISTQLALVFALRLFGLFVVLPILAPYAQTLPVGGGLAQTASNVAWMVGLAMGAYGLVQAVFYIPYGLASDVFGRKPVVLLGLLIFVVGSLWAAMAESLLTLTCARALQGAGAISSVLVAMIADNTRDEVRTRAMARVGMSIASTFALSLVLAPLLYSALGMAGVFGLIALLGVLACVVVIRLPLAPRPSVGDALSTQSARSRLVAVVRQRPQWILNIGVFALHAVQMAMWVVIPMRLIALGLTHNATTAVYLVVIVLSMVAMVPLIVLAEKRAKMREVMRGALLVLLASQLILWGQWGEVWGVGIALALFFTGFNVLEATQPSLLSKISAPASRGAAAGVYNTVQALGLFAGAMCGAWVNLHWGAAAVFVLNAVAVVLWLVVHHGWGDCLVRPVVAKAGVLP